MPLSAVASVQPRRWRGTSWGAWTLPLAPVLLVLVSRAAWTAAAPDTLALARDVDPSDPMFYVDLCVSIVLVFFGGIMSGLTVAFMSFDELNLELLMRTGTPTEQRRAATIARLVKRRHLLLVTLLVSNAAAMEALPIFLDHLVPEYVAIIISVTAVLAFGEIIPQAVFMKYRLGVCYFLAWLVWTLIVLEFIVCAPIALLLDCVLGHEATVTYTRSALRELAKMHAIDAGAGGTLHRDEVLVMQGVLEGHETPVSAVMTPLAKVFMLDVDTVLDDAMMAHIEKMKHSRLPVFEGTRENIIGILVVKRLIRVNPNDNRTLRTVQLTPVITVNHKIDLFTMLGRFQLGASHLAIVREHKKPVGIVTLEGVLQRIIKSKIMDEQDILVNDEDRARIKKRSSRRGVRPYGGAGVGSINAAPGDVVGSGGGAGGGKQANDDDTGAPRRVASMPSIVTVVNAAAKRRAKLEERRRAEAAAAARTGDAEASAAAAAITSPSESEGPGVVSGSFYDSPALAQSAPGAGGGWFAPHGHSDGEIETQASARAHDRHTWASRAAAAAAISGKPPARQAGSVARPSSASEAVAAVDPARAPKSPGRHATFSNAVVVGRVEQYARLGDHDLDGDDDAGGDGDGDSSSAVGTPSTPMDPVGGGLGVRRSANALDDLSSVLGSSLPRDTPSGPFHSDERSVLAGLRRAAANGATRGAPTSYGTLPAPSGPNNV